MGLGRGPVLPYAVDREDVVEQAGHPGTLDCDVRHLRCAVGEDAEIGAELSRGEHQRVLSHFPQRRYLPLRVRLFIYHLKNTYGNPAYWLTS